MVNKNCQFEEYFKGVIITITMNHKKLERHEILQLILKKLDRGFLRFNNNLKNVCHIISNELCS